MKRKCAYVAAMTLFLLYCVVIVNQNVNAQNVDSVGSYEHLVFDVFVVDTLAYLAGGPSELFLIVNIADATNPTFVGDHHWSGNT